jgi:hypothetical protein
MALSEEILHGDGVVPQPPTLYLEAGSEASHVVLTCVHRALIMSYPTPQSSEDLFHSVCHQLGFDPRQAGRELGDTQEFISFCEARLQPLRLCFEERETLRAQIAHARSSRQSDPARVAAMESLLEELRR